MAVTPGPRRPDPTSSGRISRGRPAALQSPRWRIGAARQLHDRGPAHRRGFTGAMMRGLVVWPVIGCGRRRRRPSTQSAQATSATSRAQARADILLRSLGCAWGDRVSQVRAFAGRRNRRAEFDSFFKTDRPKFIARHAVSLDRIATVEQSQQVRDRKRVLWLFAPAARACRYEDNGLSHGENLFLICAVEPIGQSVNGG